MDPARPARHVENRLFVDVRSIPYECELFLNVVFYGRVVCAIPVPEFNPQNQVEFVRKYKQIQDSLSYQLWAFLDTFPHANTLVLRGLFLNTPMLELQKAQPSRARWHIVNSA